MSRIGRMPITIPSGVEVTIDGSNVTVKGPKGSLSHVVVEPITVAREEDGQLAVTRPNDERESRARHGLTRTLISNMVVGVTQGYSKTLEITGTGYRVAAQGDTLEFALGYSHPVKVTAPAGITFTLRPQQNCMYQVSTSSRLAKYPQTCASFVSQIHTKQKVSVIQTKSFVARLERLARSNHVCRSQIRFR